MYGGNWCPALHTNDKHTQPPYSKSIFKFKEVYYAQFSGFMPYQVNPKAEKKSTFNAIHIISWIHICIVISLATLKGRMHCSNLFWKLKMFRRWQSPGWTIPSSPPTSHSTATRYSTWGTVCSLKIMFFFSFHCNPSHDQLILAKDLSVQSLLLADHFLNDQPSTGEGEFWKFLKDNSLGEEGPIKEFITFYKYPWIQSFD